MRSLPPAVLAELDAGRLIARDFLRIEALAPNGSPYDACFWSGVGNITTQMTNYKGGAPLTFTFEGAGGVILIGDIPLVNGITVQTVDVKLAKTAPAVEAALRTYTIRLRPVQIWRGYFSGSTRNLVYPAIPRFVGTLDFVEGGTPEVDGDDFWALTLTSATQELTRSNSAKRSDKNQRERSANDSFFKYASNVGEWKIPWGKKSSTMVDTKDYTSLGGKLLSTNGMGGSS